MHGRQQTRRRLLAGLAVPATAVLAGCGGLLPESSTPTPEPITELQDRSIYVDGSLSLSVPDVAEAVESPADADIVVLPTDTDRSNATITDWLAADRYVAFVGAGGQDAWHEVKLSDAYAEEFGEPDAMGERCAGSGGGGDGESTADCDPTDLFVIERLEDISATYGFIWNDTDDPSNRRYFEGLHDVLADDDG